MQETLLIWSRKPYKHGSLQQAMRFQKPKFTGANVLIFRRVPALSVAASLPIPLPLGSGTGFALLGVASSAATTPFSAADSSIVPALFFAKGEVSKTSRHSPERGAHNLQSHTNKLLFDWFELQGKRCHRSQRRLLQASRGHELIMFSTV